MQQMHQYLLRFSDNPDMIMMIMFTIPDSMELCDLVVVRCFIYDDQAFDQRSESPTVAPACLLEAALVVNLI